MNAKNTFAVMVIEDSAFVSAKLMYPHNVIIPQSVYDQIRQSGRAEALLEAADRAVKHIKTTYNPVLDAYVWKAEELKAAILSVEVNE